MICLLMPEFRFTRTISSTNLTAQPTIVRLTRQQGNAIKLSKILIAHVGNSVCFFHAFFLFRIMWENLLISRMLLSGKENGHRRKL